MLLLVRCCSTAPTKPAVASSEEYCSTTSTEPAAASSEEYCSTTYTEPAAASSEEYCYVLGALGKMQFSRKLFVPFDKYMKDNEDLILEPVPMDRLITPPPPPKVPLPEPVEEDPNFFTSESAKQFIRSGFLAAYFAKTLKLSFPGAFADGNVGVISGVNIIAFLELDTELSTESSVPATYPSTYSGFSSFLQAKMTEIYSSPKARRMSVGLRDLLQISHDATVSELRIIYHTEFLTLHSIASIYTEVFRILRREMPSTAEDRLAHAIILHLHAKLGDGCYNRCDSDPLLSNWISRDSKEPGLAGALGLSVPSGAELDLSRLKSSERKRLQSYTRKAYGMSPTANKTKTPATLPVYQRDPTIPLKFNKTRVMPGPNITSLQNKKPSWRDGVHLLLYNFGGYPHSVAEAFDQFGIWERLDLKARCPIPQIFFSPPFSLVDAEEGTLKADVRY